MKTKQCLKCGETKETSMFSKNSLKRDGRDVWCKSCRKQYYINNLKHIKKIGAEYRSNNLEKIKAHHRKYYKNNFEAIKLRAKKHNKTEEGKAVKNRNFKKYRTNNPEKVLAHNSIGSAVKWGKISKENCGICSATKVEGHHPSYSEPLRVIWLCSTHHRNLHKTLKMAKTLTT